MLINPSHIYIITRTTPLTSGRLKKAISGIPKNHGEYFAAGIHRIHGFERLK